MKTLLGTALFAAMTLAFASPGSGSNGNNNAEMVTCSASYQDTIPRRDSMHKKNNTRKDRKDKTDRRDRRDTLQHR